MGLFGKNNSEEISILNNKADCAQNQITEIIKMYKDLQDLFGLMQDNILKMATLQAQHKAIITFLVKHASVDPDCEEDLKKMMHEIIKSEKELTEKKE